MDLGHHIEAALIFLKGKNYNFGSVRSAIESRERQRFLQGYLANAQGTMGNEWAGEAANKAWDDLVKKETP